ncbi:MAG: hypothetical protein AAF907_11375 [Planctomycetota bacterium]
MPTLADSPPPREPFMLVDLADRFGTLLSEADDLTGGDVLPGFRIPFAKTLRRGG